MNKLTKLKPIIVNIYNSPCDFGRKLPINNITNVIETDIFQSRSYSDIDEIRVGNLISDSNLTFQLSNFTTSSNIDTIVEDVNELKIITSRAIAESYDFLVGNTSIIPKQPLRSFITLKQGFLSRDNINISVQMDNIVFQEGR